MRLHLFMRYQRSFQQPLTDGDMCPEVNIIEGETHVFIVHRVLLISTLPTAYRLC